MEKLTKTIGDRVGVICDKLFKGRAQMAGLETIKNFGKIKRFSDITL